MADWDPKHAPAAEDEMPLAKVQVIVDEGGRKPELQRLIYGGERKPRYPTKQLDVRMARVLDQLEGVLDTLTSFLEEPHPPSQAQHWAARLRRSRARLARMIHQEEER